MIHNRTEETRQVQTDTHAAYISRRPTWAEHAETGDGAIEYAWTAPTVAQSIDRDGEMCVAPVMITRYDMLYVNDEGVVLDPGPERIFLLDTNLDVENARKLAAAIVECCDRINSTLAVDQ